MQAEAQDRYSGTSKRGEMARADSNLSGFAGRLSPARDILSDERGEGPRTLMIVGWNGRADSNLSGFAGRLGPAREILSEERREGPRTLMIFGWNGRHERTRTADLFRVKEAL
jgi:hypothetical protein